MKVLTLHQPWASLVALGVKTIETRSWTTKYRGPLAIHAAARYPEDGSYPDPGHWETYAPCGAPELVEYGGDEMRTWVCRYQLPLGAIVATCMLDDVVPITDSGKDAIYEQLPYGDFTPGRYAWLLSDVKPVDPPVRFKGGQGLSREWTP